MSEKISSGHLGKRAVSGCDDLDVSDRLNLFKEDQIIFLVLQIYLWLTWRNKWKNFNLGETETEYTACNGMQYAHH